MTCETCREDGDLSGSSCLSCAEEERRSSTPLIFRTHASLFPSCPICGDAGTMRESWCICHEETPSLSAEEAILVTGGDL